MAHSIQKYGNKHVIINDLDLIVIIGFALRTIERSSEFKDFQNLSVHWRECLRQYGPGCINLKIDAFAKTVEEVQRLSALFGAIVDQIGQYYEVIPADILNKQFSISGVRFFDFKMSLLKESVKKLQDLIGG